MNSLVQLYRQHFPDDQRSDDQITLDLAQQYPDQLNTFPDAKSDYDRIQGDLRRTFEPSLAGEFTRAAAAGWDSLKGSFYGAGGLAAAKLGLDSAKDYLMGKASQAQSDAEQNAPTIPNIGDIDSTSDALHYTAAQLGNLTPNLLETMAFAAGGTIAGAGAGGAVDPAGGEIPGGIAGFVGGIIKKKAIKNLIEQSVEAATKSGIEDIASAEGKSFSAQFVKQGLSDEMKRIGASAGTTAANTLNFY